MLAALASVLRSAGSKVTAAAKDRAARLVVEGFLGSDVDATRAAAAGAVGALVATMAEPPTAAVDFAASELLDGAGDAGADAHKLLPRPTSRSMQDDDKALLFLSAVQRCSCRQPKA